MLASSVMLQKKKKNKPVQTKVETGDSGNASYALSVYQEYYCGTVYKQVVECTSTIPNMTYSKDRLNTHGRPSLSVRFYECSRQHPQMGDNSMGKTNKV